MNTVTIKECLHEYIDRADEKHLEAIYTLVEKDISSSYQYDKATLEMLHQRRNNHLSGKSKSYTIEETLQYIRAYNK